MKKRKKSFKEWILDRLYSLIPIGELCVAVGLSIGYVLVFIILFLNAHRLKWLFIPAFLVYLIPIFFIKYFIEKRDAKNHIRALGGDELYADLYPKEAEKLARKKQKALEKAERKVAKNSETIVDEKTARKKKLRKRDQTYIGPEF